MNQSHEKVGFVVVEHPYFRKFPKNAQLFNEFLDKGGINILLKWFEKAQEFESINGVLFSLPFCLSAAFAKFYPLPTTKIVEKRHIIECIFKIVDFLRKSIDNPDIAMWIMRDDSLDNMWKKEHIRHVYNLLNSHQQENIIPQVISCTLATSCATHLICGAILSNWIANMTDTQFQTFMIGSDFVTQAKTALINATSKPQQQQPSHSVSSIQHYHPADSCTSIHAVILMIIVEAMIQRFDGKMKELGVNELPQEWEIDKIDAYKGKVQYCVIRNGDRLTQQLIIDKIIEINLIDVVLRAILDNINSVEMIENGYQSLFQLFSIFQYADMDSLVYVKYLIFDTLFLETFCKVINYASEQSDKINFRALIVDFTHVIGVLCEKDRMILHAHKNSDDRESEIELNLAENIFYTLKIVDSLNEHLAISAQTFVNSLVLTRIIGCNISQKYFPYQWKNSSATDLYTLLARRRDKPDGTDIDTADYHNFYRFDLIIPYFKGCKHNPKNESEDRTLGQTLVLLMQCHEASQDYQRTSLKYGQTDCYGMSIFDYKIGCFGILLYIFFNTENLILKMEPTNRQCLRILRTSMAMFAKYSQKRSVATDITYWTPLMKFTFVIYSFYNINVGKLDIQQSSKHAQTTTVDYKVLNQNYQFVNKYLQKFVIDIAHHDCEDDGDTEFGKKQNTTDIDIFSHIKNHFNYVVGICYAFSGNKQQALCYQSKCTQHGTRTKWIDNMINSAIEMDITEVHLRQKQSLETLKEIISKHKREAQELHQNNLVSNAYLYQHQQFVRHVLDKNTRNEMLYLQWKNATCVKKCHACCNHRQTHRLYKCKRCKSVFYCSKRCQKKDWNSKNHLCIELSK